MNKKVFHYRAVAEILKAIAHPTRLRILNVLLTKKGCVRQLEKLVGKQQANISQHLIILRKAGLVDFDERGRQRCYFLKDAGMVRKIMFCIKISGDKFRR